MITHTSDSHQIPSQNKTRSKLQIEKKKKLSKIQFQIVQKTLHATHLQEMLIRMYKYKLDPTRTVGSTEQTQDAGRTDGQADGRNETNISLTTSMCGGYNDATGLCMHYL